jgi:anti-sigma factor RsiW
MRECVDEGVLQSFADGELSRLELERVSSHLAHCQLCSAAAQELANENELVFAALAPEFETVVPTERLRERIGSAVAGLQSHSLGTERSIFARLSQTISSLFQLPQPALSYAGLAAVLLFASVAGVVYFRSDVTAPGSPIEQVAEVTPSKTTPAEANPSKSSQLVPADRPSAAPVSSTAASAPVRPNRSRPAANATIARVKLLPGERSYLKTIAALDSSIKSSDRPMRPSLRAEYERNLALVDRALAAARNAAKNNPNDPDAAEFVFAAYQSKVDLLNTVADARVYNRQR